MDLKPLNIKLLYIVAISAIIALLFIIQLVVQTSIKNQSSDTTLINLAGKERMFSQNVAKTSLQILVNKNNVEEIFKHAGILHQLISDWQYIHIGLQRKDKELGLHDTASAEINSLFSKINPPYQKIISTAIALAENPDKVDLQQTVSTILSNEKFFLTTMNKIVSQYELEAKEKVGSLVITEISLSILLLLVLLFEITFIFRPAYNKVKEVNINLLTINEELNATNKMLSQKEEKLKKVQHLGKMGTWEWNLAANKIYWSDEIFEIFDVNSSQFDQSYEAYLDLIHPDDKTAVDEIVQRTLKNKKPFHVEHRILSANGEIKYIKGEGSLSVDELGNPVKVKGMLQEITDQKVAQNTLKKSEENLKEAERIGNIGSWELHVPSGSLHCSEEFLRIFGLEKDKVDILHDVILQKIHPEDRDRVDKALNDNYGQRIPYHLEYRIIVDEDSIRHVVARAETYFDSNGKPLTMRGVILDITNRKENERMLMKIRKKQNELEKQQEKMKSLAILEGEEKERMRFSMELHDGVGQILTALKIHVKILSEQGLENKSELDREILAEIKKLVKNATFEIRRISDNLTPKLLKDFGLTEGIDNLINILLERSDIEVTKNISLGNKRYKDQVEISLFRIMQEVFQNIIKHADAHHVSVALKEDDANIELKVADDGKGFDILTMKNRTNQSNGLTNLQHRIDLLNGNLYISSTIGNGCRILVNIPLN